MTVLLPTGFAQIVLNWDSAALFESGSGATVLGFGSVLDPLEGWGSFCNSVAAAYSSYLAPQQSVEVGLSSIYWQDRDNSGEESVGVSGARSGQVAPPQVAFLTTYRTVRKGPRGRGRSYWPGFLNDEDISNGGGILGARMTQLTLAFDEFWEEVTELSALAQPQVILQHITDTQVSEPITPPPVVTDRLYRGRTGTQRQRNRR